MPELLDAPKLPKGEYPELSPNPNEKKQYEWLGSKTPTVPGNNPPRTQGSGNELLFKIDALLIGSDLIVIDRTEDGERLQVRLDKSAHDAIKLVEIDEADITVDGTAQGGAVITTPADHFNPDATHHAIVEIETAGTHSSVSLDLCAYNGDVCFATGQINIGGSIKTVNAAIQEDGSLTVQIANVELATTDTVRIKHTTYAE